METVVAYFNVPFEHFCIRVGENRQTRNGEFTRRPNPKQMQPIDL
jgi:hypothetical protein